MHSIKLSIQDDIFETFIGYIKTQHEQNIQIEEINEVPYYPSISYKEAQHKIEKAVSSMNNDSYESIDKVFDDILQ
jgi:serine kinase of HPr protein (carbohydrate metabolism regulator)